jgi:hypothetical protein
LNPNHRSTKPHVFIDLKKVHNGYGEVLWGPVRLILAIWAQFCINTTAADFGGFGSAQELFEATWTKNPNLSDAVILDFFRNAIGISRVLAARVASRTPNSFHSQTAFEPYL